MSQVEVSLLVSSHERASARQVRIPAAGVTSSTVGYGALSVFFGAGAVSCANLAFIAGARPLPHYWSLLELYFSIARQPGTSVPDGLIARWALLGGGDGPGEVRTPTSPPGLIAHGLLWRV